MSWIRIDDHAVWHRKLVAAGPMAGWLWLCGLSYANQQPAHDGFIPDDIVPFLPMKNAEKYVRDLLRVGLWERVDGGYIVHDYHEFQPSKADVEELREGRAKAGRAGGIKSGETRRKQRDEAARQAQDKADAEAMAKQVASADAKQNETPSRPVPTTEEIPPLPPEGGSGADGSYRVDAVRDDVVANWAVPAWAMGIRSVTGAQAEMRPAGFERSKLVDALKRHCPPGQDITAWAERAGVAYATANRARTLDGNHFARWLASGGFVPEAKREPAAAAPSLAKANDGPRVPQEDIERLLAGTVLREGSLGEKLR